MGEETECDFYDGISFTNCDLIHNSVVAISIDHWNRAELRNLTFSDLRVELNNEDGGEVYQQSDDQIYERSGGLPMLLFFRTTNHFPIKRVRVDNISVFADNGFPKPTIVINDNEPVFEDISLENFYINGKKASPEDFEVKVSSEKVRFS